MFTNDLKAMVVKALGAGGLLLLATACAGGAGSEPRSQTQGLSADAAVPLVRAARGVLSYNDTRPSVTPRGVLAQCTEFENCGADEQCCPVSGKCVPADCHDCCLSPELHAGLPPDPELEVPEAPPEPR